MPGAESRCSKCGSKIVYARPKVRGPHGWFRALRPRWVGKTDHFAKCPRGGLHESTRDN